MLQGPENTAEESTVTAVDPEAPYGRRPDGSPYKRDPGPFKHLRGRPFGSNSGAAKPPAPRASSAKPKPRASVDGPLASDAEGYKAKFTKLFRTGAKFLARKSPTPAAIVYMRAPEMADAWGRVAVSYPKFGRLVDRFGKTGDLSEAISSTVTTALMVAHTAGLTKGTWVEPLIDEAVHDLLDRFAQDSAAAEKLGVVLTVPDGMSVDGSPA